MDGSKLTEFAERLVSLGAIRRRRPVDWAYYESKLGLILPDDYKALLDRVCGVTAANVCSVLEPHLSKDDPSCLLGQAHFNETYEIMREYEPKKLWRPLPPADHSFVFWAYNAGQHGLAWEVMNGQITDTILAVDIEDPATVMATRSMTDTLQALIERKITIPNFEHRDENYINPIKPIKGVAN